MESRADFAIKMFAEAARDFSDELERGGLDRTEPLNHFFAQFRSQQTEYLGRFGPVEIRENEGRQRRMLEIVRKQLRLHASYVWIPFLVHSVFLLLPSVVHEFSKYVPPVHAHELPFEK